MAAQDENEQEEEEQEREDEDAPRDPTEQPSVRRRGRPPGTKNKPKAPVPRAPREIARGQYLPVPEQHLAEPDDEYLDEESKAMNRRLRERQYVEEKRGDRRQVPAAEIDDASLYALQCERHLKTGKLTVELTGIEPVSFKGHVIPATRVPTYGDLVAYCQQKWWHGEHAVFEWRLRLGGAEWKGKGKIELYEDELVKLEWQAKIEIAKIETQAKVEEAQRRARGEVPRETTTAAAPPAEPPPPPAMPRPPAGWPHGYPYPPEAGWPWPQGFGPERHSPAAYAQQQPVMQQPAAPQQQPRLPEDPRLTILLQEQSALRSSLERLVASQETRDRLASERADRVDRRRYGIEDEDLFEPAPHMAPQPPAFNRDEPPPPPVPKPGWVVIGIDHYPGWALMTKADADRLALPQQPTAASPVAAVVPVQPPVAPAQVALVAPQTPQQAMKETMQVAREALNYGKEFGKAVGLVEPSATPPPGPPPGPPPAPEAPAPERDPFIRMGEGDNALYFPRDPRTGDVEDNVVKTLMMNIPGALGFLSKRQNDSVKRAVKELELRRQAAQIEAYEADAKARKILTERGYATQQPPMQPPPPVTLPPDEDDDEEDEVEVAPEPAAPPPQAPSNNGISSAIGAIGGIGNGG